MLAEMLDTDQLLAELNRRMAGGTEPELAQIAAEARRLAADERETQRVLWAVAGWCDEQAKRKQWRECAETWR